MLIAPLTLLADAAKFESMEKQRWEYVKNHNWKELENLTAPYYQEAFFDGARNKEQYLNQARSVNIGDYTLNNFQVTEGPGVGIVTYNIAVSETIGGKRITSNASRLTVWQNNDGKWQVIAHAVLIPVPSS